MSVNSPIMEGESWGYLFASAPTSADSHYPNHTLAFLETGQLFLLKDNTEGQAQWIKISHQMRTGWFNIGNLQVSPTSSFGGAITGLSFKPSNGGMHFEFTFDDLGYTPIPNITLSSLYKPHIDNHVFPPVIISSSATAVQCFFQASDQNQNRNLKAWVHLSEP